MPLGVELSSAQWFFGLVIEENQVTLIVLPRIEKPIILKLRTSFIFFVIHRGNSMLLIEML